MGEKLSDSIVKRLNNLMDMWGYNFRNIVAGNNKKK